MTIHTVAPGLLRLSLLGNDLINVYLAGDVLVDAGGQGASRKIIRALKDQKVTALALTHAHVDHQGGAADVCRVLGIPLWCGAGDREAAESGDHSSLLPNPRGFLARASRFLRAPGFPVSRTLEEGDEVGGFSVVEAPGHTPGHLAYWRETDRILILGDVLFNRNPLTLRRGLREPFRVFTHNPGTNRESARKLAGLEPEIVCFGHGAHLTEGSRFKKFVESL